MKTLTLITAILLAACSAIAQDSKLLVEKYEAECYRDSTQKDEHFNPDGWGGSPCWIETDQSPFLYWEKPRSVCRRPDHWRKVWMHKAPTYEGFKRWIGIEPPESRVYLILTDSTKAIMKFDAVDTMWSPRIKRR